MHYKRGDSSSSYQVRLLHFLTPLRHKSVSVFERNSPPDLLHRINAQIYIARLLPLSANFYWFFVELRTYCRPLQLATYLLLLSLPPPYSLSLFYLFFFTYAKTVKFFVNFSFSIQAVLASVRYTTKWPCSLISNIQTSTAETKSFTIMLK